MKNRKEYKSVDQNIYEQIKRLLPRDSIKKIMDITNFGRSQIYKIKHFIEINPVTNNYHDFAKKTGRKQKDNTNLENEVREICGRDNSLTQLGINKALEKEGIHLSKSSVGKLVEFSGLTRKRLKLKASVILNESHKRKVAEYASKIIGLRRKCIVFVDECGFNLHVSNNYGYSAPNQDAVAMVRSSRGRNISVWAIFSIEGIVGYKLLDGGFDRIHFLEFLRRWFLMQKFQGIWFL